MLSFPRLAAILSCLTLCALIASSGCSHSTSYRPHHSSPGAIVPFDEYVMPNGLRVILAPDPSAGIVGVDVAYDVGSRNEDVGKSGLAHLCEHLMFKGSPHVSAGEHLALVESVGGYANGGTTKDYTHYYETVPANQLPLALFLESDRMRGLDIQANHIEQVRREVLEEKRERHDDVAYDPVSTACYGIAFTKYPYRHPAIGADDDLNAITGDDVRTFIDKYYKPNHAVIAICGQFDAQKVRGMMTRYFGDIPRGSDLPALDDSEPASHPSGIKNVFDDVGHRGMYMRGYVVKGGNDPDTIALQVLAAAFADGDLSPLQKSVGQSMGASDVKAEVDVHRDWSMFQISFKYPDEYFDDGHVSRMRTAVDKEIEHVADSGITVDELHRAQAYVKDRLLEDIQTRRERATQLAKHAVFYDDPDTLNTAIARVMNVTPADVQHVCLDYLDPAQMSQVYSGPNEAWSAPDGSASPASVDKPSIWRAIGEFLGHKSAAGPPPVVPEIDAPKNAAPVAPLDISPLAVPAPITLPNGLKIILCEDHRTPVVNIEACLTAGRVDEDAPGVATMALASACAGIQGESADAFEDDLDQHGIETKWESYTDYGHISVSGPSEATDRIVSTMDSILCRPSFPPERVERIRQKQLEEHKDTDYHALNLSHDLAMARLGRLSPYLKPTAHGVDIAKIQLAQITSFYKRNVRPNRTLIVVVGDFDRREVLKSLTKGLQGWQSGQPPSTPPAPSAETTGTRMVVVWPFNPTVRVNLTCQAPAVGARDYEAFIVADHIL